MIIVIRRSRPVLTVDQELAQLLPAALLSRCEECHCAAGEVLFLRGVRPRWLYFVSEGELALERHGRRGEVVCVQRTRHGFFGEASLVADRYHCDGRAALDSRVTRIPVGALRVALQRDGAFAQRWIRMLSQEVRRLRSQNERLALTRVEDRIVHLLETEGRDGRYATGSSLKMLARELAVSHEALYRALARLEKSGRIGRQPGEVRLLGRPRPVRPA